MPSISDSEETEDEEPSSNPQDSEAAETAAAGGPSVPSRPAEPSVEAEKTLRVHIETMARAAEIYVVNRAYAMVASGVGSLSVKLEPGPYKVRQRIGYTESVHDMVASEDQGGSEWHLPPLEFPSPIPLWGTSLFAAGRDAPRPFSIGEGNFRFVLRVPVDRDRTLTAGEETRLRGEMSRLRLESFDGKQVLPLTEGCTIDEQHGTLAFSARLEPGAYVLVQNVSGDTQVCLPVPLWWNYTTAVFALALGDEGVPVPLQFAHAAIATLRTDQLSREYEGSLLRLEAARKAIGAGRSLFGWSQTMHLPQGDGSLENPILSLLDWQQALRQWMTEWQSPANAQGAADRTPKRPSATHTRMLIARFRDDLGQNSADAVSLGLTVAHWAGHAAEAETPNALLAGPPLLRGSWDQLLATPEGDKLAGRQMPFVYQVLPSSTWFIWHEAPGARATGLKAAAVIEAGFGAHIRKYEVPLPELGGGGLGGLVSSIKLSVPLGSILSMGLNAMRHVARRIPVLRKTAFSGALDSVTIEDVEAMLAALLKSKSFEEWLNKAQQVFEAEGKTIRDESMRKLIAGLRAFSDVTLVNALGPEVVAKQVLATLRLPQSRVVPLVKELLKGVVTRLAGPDRKNILKVLHSSLDVAEAWLLTPPKNP